MDAQTPLPVDLPKRTPKGTRIKRPKRPDEKGYPAPKLTDAYRGRQLLNADTSRRYS